MARHENIAYRYIQNLHKKKTIHTHFLCDRFSCTQYRVSTKCEALYWWTYTYIRTNFIAWKFLVLYKQGISREGSGCRSTHAKLTQKRRKTFSHHTSIPGILTKMVVYSWVVECCHSLLDILGNQQRGILYECVKPIHIHFSREYVYIIICGRKIWKSELTRTDTMKNTFALRVIRCEYEG